MTNNIFLYMGGIFYHVLPFGLCNFVSTLHRVIIRIFSDLVHDCMKNYMDDFITYGDEFNEALANLEKKSI